MATIKKKNYFHDANNSDNYDDDNSAYNDSNNSDIYDVSNNDNHDDNKCDNYGDNIIMITIITIIVTIEWRDNYNECRNCSNDNNNYYVSNYITVNNIGDYDAGGSYNSNNNGMIRIMAIIK